MTLHKIKFKKKNKIGSWKRNKKEKKKKKRWKSDIAALNNNKILYIVCIFQGKKKKKKIKERAARRLVSYIYIRGVLYNAGTGACTHGVKVSTGANPLQPLFVCVCGGIPLIDPPSLSHFYLRLNVRIYTSHSETVCTI